MPLGSIFFFFFENLDIIHTIMSKQIFLLSKYKTLNKSKTFLNPNLVQRLEKSCLRHPMSHSVGFLANMVYCIGLETM
jgi:hypothetical protein